MMQTMGVFTLWKIDRFHFNSDTTDCWFNAHYSPTPLKDSYRLFKDLKTLGVVIWDMNAKTKTISGRAWI